MKVTGKLSGFIPALLAISILLLQGCSGYKDIRVTSCRVESLSMKGLKSVDVTVSAGFRNPAPEISVSEVCGAVFLEGSEVGFVNVEEFVIPGRGDSEVPVEGRFSLNTSLPLKEAMSILSDFHPEDCTMDVSMKIKVKGGISKRLKFSDVPLEDLFKLTNYEQL